MKLHVKGRILQIVHEASNDGIWDYEIANKILVEYNKSGAYWMGTVRVTLTDLYSSGLIDSVEEKIDDGTHFGSNKVLFKFKMTEFGIERMLDTNLLKRSMIS